MLFGVGRHGGGDRGSRSRSCTHVPSAEQVVLCGSGSEATFHAIRLARGVTGRRRSSSSRAATTASTTTSLRNFLSARAPFTRRRRSACRPLDAHARLPRSTTSTTSRRLFARAAGDRRRGHRRADRPQRRRACCRRPGFLEGLRSLCDRDGLAADLRRGDHRLSPPPRRLPGDRGRDARPHDARQGDRQRLPARGGRRARASTWSASRPPTAATSTSAARATATCRASRPRSRPSSCSRAARCTSTSSASASACAAGLREVARRASRARRPSAASARCSCLCFMEGAARVLRGRAAQRHRSCSCATGASCAQRGVFEMPESLGRSHLMYSHTDADVDLTLEAAEEALRSALRSPPA